MHAIMQTLSIYINKFTEAKIKRAEISVEWQNSVNNLCSKLNMN